jgi:hypothetical protein
MFHMGAGLLAQPRNIGQGLLGGMGSYQQYMGNQQQQAQNQLYQQTLMAKMERERQEREKEAGRQAAQQRVLGSMAPEPTVPLRPGGEQGGMLDIAEGYPGMAQKMVEQRMFPKTPKLDPEIQRYQYGLENPAFREYEMGKKRASKPEIDIRTGEARLPTDREILRKNIIARGEEAYEFNKGLLTDAFGAQKSIADYDRILNLLDTAATGPLEETKLKAKRLAGKMGFDIDVSKIASGEELRVLLGNEVMSRIGETKGAVSEKEMDLFREYSANYGNTPEGNRAIINWKKAKAQRDIEIGKIIRAGRKARKNAVQIQDEIWAYIDQHDISSTLTQSGVQGMAGLSQEEMSELEELRKQQGAM